MHSMGLNRTMLCPCLESCSPLVLLLVGNLLRQRRSWYAHVQKGSMPPEVNYRQLMEEDLQASANEQQEMNAPGMPLLWGVMCNLLQRFQSWTLFPSMLMLLNSLWLWGMHWAIKDGVFLSATVYRIYSCYHKIGAIMNGPGLADPSQDRAWHWLWGSSRSKAGELVRLWALLLPLRTGFISYVQLMSRRFPGLAEAQANCPWDKSCSPWTASSRGQTWSAGLYKAVLFVSRPKPFLGLPWHCISSYCKWSLEPSAFLSLWSTSSWSQMLWSWVGGWMNERMDGRSNLSWK